MSVGIPFDFIWVYVNFDLFYGICYANFCCFSVADVIQVVITSATIAIITTITTCNNISPIYTGINSGFTIHHIK